MNLLSFYSQGYLIFFAIETVNYLQPRISLRCHEQQLAAVMIRHASRRRLAGKHRGNTWKRLLRKVHDSPFTRTTDLNLGLQYWKRAPSDQT